MVHRLVSHAFDTISITGATHNFSLRIVARSRIMHPQFPPLNIGGTVQKESDDRDLLGVTFNSKITFEKYLRSVFRAASQRL